MKKYLVKKILLTLVLFSFGFLCYKFPIKITVEQEFQLTKDFKKTITTENDGLKVFFEYIGLFLLVVAAWQWRNEIGFDSFGFMSKQPDVKPTDPDNKENLEGDTPPKNIPPTIESVKNDKIDNEYKDYAISDYLKRILDLMSENPNSITNSMIISNKLGLSRQTTEKYLYELLKNKLIRKDTYPGSRNAIYSLSNSLDNLAIDFFAKNHLSKEEIISDYRYVRFKDRLEIDAIIKTNKTNYIIETKFISQINNRSINRGIQQLLRIEEEIYLEPVTLILLTVGNKQDIDNLDIANVNFKDNLKIYCIEKEKLTTLNNNG